MSSFHAARDEATAAAEALKMYAQPQRLMILSRLLEGEQVVAEIERETGIGQPALSQQLAELRRAGLVTMRRSARQVFYSLSGDRVRLRIDMLEMLFGSEHDAGGALAAHRITAGSRQPAPPAAPFAAAAFATIESRRAR